MFVPRDALARGSRLHRGGQAMFVALIILPLLVSIVMSDDPLTLAEIAVVAALAVIEIIGMSDAVIRRVETARAEVRGFYFLTILLIAGGIIQIFARHGSAGMSWLLLMPIVAVASLVLSWWGIAIVTAGAGMAFLFPLHEDVGWATLPETIIGFAAAVGFVILFSRVTLRESRARLEIERLATELADANERLSRHAVQAEELAATRERNRIGREIHDTLGHALTVINVQLEASLVTLPEKPDLARESIVKARDLTRQGLEDVRRSVGTLRGSPLDGRTLSEAIRALVDEAKAYGLEARLQIDGEVDALPEATRLALYRTTQEGLTNVRKHAEASRVDVSLDGHAAKKVRLVIEDDGRGSKTNAPGFGLLGLRERASLLGGSIETASSEHGGFRLEIEVPR